MDTVHSAVVMMQWRRLSATHSVDTVYTFTGQYPAAWFYVTGSTETRTRLYRMGINKYFDIVKEDFDIMGEHQSEWEWYEKGRDYQAYAVHRKNQ